MIADLELVISPTRKFPHWPAPDSTASALGSPCKHSPYEILLHSFSFSHFKKLLPLPEKLISRAAYEDEETVNRSPGPGFLLVSAERLFDPFAKIGWRDCDPDMKGLGDQARNEILQKTPRSAPQDGAIVVGNCQASPVRHTLSSHHSQLRQQPVAS